MESNPRIQGNEFVSCYEIPIYDKEIIMEMGKLKPKQRKQPKEFLMCLNCSYIQELEQIHKQNVQTYETIYQEIDSKYYNQRSLRKKELKPYEYLKQFNEDVGTYLDKLKKSHKEEFELLKDKCTNKSDWW